MKKQITENEYLQLEGLLAIARVGAQKISYCEEAAAVLLRGENEKDKDNYDAGGYLISDNVWDSEPANLRQKLKASGVNIVKR